jgi:eukaryotic-like serine/threonine-protein kinase
MNSLEPVPPAPGFTLSPGSRLGPYHIVSPLGAGGMGEVYRARDPRLRRDVAVKILHRSISLTPQHVERLGREARAAGSLNHPNIVAVFDVGMEGPVPYVVSELLEGESLRLRIARAPLPYRKALEYGIQLAQALGAAHEKGIWHRDVKPGNAFITTDGRLKLLDFGLVKLRPRPVRVDSNDSTADFTEPGGMHGTLGYMSPEQVLGEDVDHRTDIFALGAVLFEMLTGSPAFRRASSFEAAKAVLNEEPADVLERNGSVPQAAAVVVRRCLEKNREERFQSARDLAFHLQQLHEIAAPARSQPGLRISRRRATIVAVLGVTVLAGAAWAMVQLLQRPVPAFEQLTFRRGRIGGARFAEGGAIVYSEAREGKPLEVWWLGGPNRESRLLGHVGSDVLATHRGRLALSLERRFVVGDRFVGTLAEAPLGEGSPHERVKDVDDADWDPSGKALAVAHWTTPGGESRLEYPPGTKLYDTPGSLRYLRFSPDGLRIAFLEDPSGRAAGGRVAMVDLQGRYTRLTGDWPSAHGLAWSPNGREVWFAAGTSRSSRALRAVDLDGRERVVLQAPASVTLRDVASDGRVLLTRDEERSALVGVPPGETGERDLSWFDTSSLSDLSEDGKLLLFGDRFGLYIRRTDGSRPPIHLGLTDAFADAFSPDGTRILATTSSGQQLVILPAGLGEAVPLPSHGINAYKGARWFPDGKHVLFNGTQPGQKLRAYIQDVESGRPRALTPEDTWVTAISPDGEHVATIGSEPGIVLWPVTPGTPRRVPASHAGDRPVAWSADGRSLWVFRRGEVPAEVARLDISTGQRQLWKKLTPPDPSGVYSISDFCVTRDGRAYFYSYKRALSQLYTVTGLR